MGRHGGDRYRMDIKHKNIIKVLEMISADMQNDASDFEGRPFSGRNVAEYFGNQGAAISTLADIVKEIVEKLNE